MNISAIMRKPGALCACVTGNTLFNSLLIRQLMRVSIIVTIILLTTVQLLLAFNVKGQDMTIEKVTVGLKGEPLEVAIKQIEHQTTLRFFYRKAEINMLNKLNLPVDSRTIEQTLYDLLQNTYFTFRQVDQNILIQVNDQSTMIKRKVTGFVLTSDTKEAVKFAMVELLRKKDLQLVGQTNTDSTGRFELTTIDNAEHLIRVSLLGYHVYSTVINDKENLTLPAIYLQPDPKVLQEVAITARSPLVKQEVDRLTYNVQADPENKFNSLLDMLRKVPLVSVDADDNVKLKGSTSFKVLIDGHTSSLVVNDPKEIFRSMAASNIQRIEVITIPPAKYDSEGLTGIINIITVKKLTNGYSGNFGVLYKFPNGPRGNGSFNLKNGKFAMSAYAGLSEYDIPVTSFSVDRTSIFPIASTVNQEGSAHTKSKLGYASAQMSYEIDSLNLISAILGYNGGSSHRVSNIYTLQTDSITHRYKLDNNGSSQQHGYDLGLDYQLGFRRNKAELLSFSYRFSSTTNSQLNALTASEQLNYNISDYNQDNKAGTKEHTLQADYTYPLKYIDIEGGVKTIFRNNFSNYNLEVADPSGSFLNDINNSNDFSYQQNIYSFYNSYQLNLEKWTLKTGLRLEMTTVNADFSTGNSIAIPGYNNLIPSIAVQRKITQAESVNFGYTERIQRPGISQLNPYIDQQDPNFITYGNPDLKPEINHILSFSYSLFKNIGVNAGLSYSFSNNTIQYVSSLSTDGVTRGTYENLGVNNNLETDINLNLPLNKRMNLSFNGQVSYITLKGTADSNFYSRKAFIGNCNLYLSYKFDHEWRTGFNFQYYSPAITLQGTSSPYYYTSLSLSKTIFNKKLNIYGSISNPYLKYLNYKIKYLDPRFNQTTQNDIVYRRFNIGLNYSFGKLREGSVKKNKKTIQNDDIKVIPSTLPNN
jgi:hypothetical protein